MTYQNDFEIAFEHNGTKYIASANATVELSKQDVGPIRYRDHSCEFVTDSVMLENLCVGDFDKIPDDIRQIAESKLTDIASQKAEEECWDE